jgi:hypothetical protein
MAAALVSASARSMRRRPARRQSVLGRPVAKAAALVALVVTALVAMQASAQANPFPNNANKTIADNGTHTYCYTSGFTTDRSIATYAMSVLDSTTDMSDLFPTTPEFCSFRETDVWWWEMNLTDNLRGRRVCRWESPAGICKSSDLQIDFAELDEGSNDWYDRRKTAVHELGHSVGLGHDTISAMREGEIPDTSLTWRRYSAHDISHINAAY